MDDKCVIRVTLEVTFSRQDLAANGKLDEWDVLVNDLAGADAETSRRLAYDLAPGLLFLAVTGVRDGAVIDGRLEAFYAGGDHYVC